MAAAITAVIVAVLVHAGLSGVLARLGLGSGGGVVVIVAIVTMKLLVVFGLRRWLRHR